MGQIPSRVGYQPTLASEIAELEERICNTAGGAITGSLGFPVAIKLLK
jgi:F-type H+-transporting ATPase subunit beta